MIFDPDVRTHYDPDTDALLLALYYETPDSLNRTTNTRVGCRVRPTFASWLQEVPEEAYFLDVDPNRVGDLDEKIRCVFPPDKSVLKFIEYNVGGNCLDDNLNVQAKTRNYVLKDETVYGFHPDGAFWVVFPDRTRATVESLDDSVCFTMTMRNGLVVK
jgi:hypothetical protein